MRLLANLGAVFGLCLCLATAGTGIWFIKHPEIKEMHLKLAVSCVTVSLIAHIFALVALKRAKG